MCVWSYKKQKKSKKIDLSTNIYVSLWFGTKDATEPRQLFPVMQCWYPLLVPLKEVVIMFYFFGFFYFPMKQEQFKVCNFSTPLQKKLHVLPLGEKSSVLKYHLTIARQVSSIKIIYSSSTALNITIKYTSFQPWNVAEEAALVNF